MGAYDVCCPDCGRLNRSLYLEETDGWMECEGCHKVSKVQYKRKIVIRPMVKTKPCAIAFAGAI